MRIDQIPVSKTLPGFLFSLLCLLIWSGQTAAVANSADKKATILYASGVTDIFPNNRQAGFARLAGAIQELRNENPDLLVLYGGDTLGPSQLSTFDQGKHMIEMLNLLQPAALSLSIRELMFGPEVLAERIGEAAFPVISTNLDFTTSTGEPDALSRTRIIERNGIKIGLISILDPNGMVLYNVEGLVPRDPEPVLKQSVEALKKDGADIIVVMTDGTVDQARNYRSIPGVDVAFVADDIEQQASIDPLGAQIMLGGTNKIAVLDVYVPSADGDEKPKVGFRTRIIDVSPDDPNVEELVPDIRDHQERLQRELSVRLDITIGTVRQSMQTKRDSLRTEENAFANMVADRLMTAFDADLALVNGGTIRGDHVYQPGDAITLRDIIRELPFSSHPTVLAINGAQLHQVIENGLSDIENLAGRFPQLSSGMQVLYNPDKPPGRRVLEIKLNNTPVRAEKTYTIAVSDYLAEGGDGYEIFKDLKRVVPTQSSVFFWQLLLEGVKQSGGFAGTLEERLKIVSEEDVAKPRTVAEGDKPTIPLSDAEWEYLQSFGALKLGIDPSYAPIEFLDEQGQHRGITSGFSEAVQERLGLIFVPLTGRSWAEMMELAKSGDVDIIPGIIKTPEREKYLSFGDPYLDIPNVIVARKKAPYIENLGSLGGKTVGVIDGFALEELIRLDYPHVRLQTFKDVTGGLSALSTGKIDAFVENLAAVEFAVEQAGLSNLKIAALTQYNLQLSIAVPPKNADLIPLLDRALRDMDDAEKTAIKNRWISIAVEVGLDWATVLRWVVPIGLALVLIVVVVLVWNRRMGREIENRKRAEAQLKIGEEQLTSALNMVSGSIQYASRIQRSILPDSMVMDGVFADYFVLWEPRDVVGGDMYWCDLWGDGVLVILGDCTGHGVPGAFMTLITTGALDRAKSEVEVGDLPRLVQRMHQFVQITLGQNTEIGESDDGMELGAVYIDADAETVAFTGARFELYAVDQGEVDIFKGTKKGIGYRGISYTQEYAMTKVPVTPGKRFYMTSDGLIDQIGGPKRRAFGKKRIKNLLLDIAQLPGSEQKEKIRAALSHYQGEESRRDDVSVLGIHIG